MAYNYADLLSALQSYRQQNSGAQVMTDEMGRPLLNEDGTSRMTGGVDPNSINDWNNGLTGNQGVSYSYDPASDSFRVVQGDATSGFQRYAVNQQGATDLGFEDYDKNKRMQGQWGTMAALAAATVGAGILAEAWAASAGLSQGGQAAITGGTAGSGGAGTGIAGAIDGMMTGTIPEAGLSAMAPTTAATGATGGLSMESILANNFATNPMAMPGVTELGQTAMYGAPATVAGGSAAMQGLSNIGPLDTGLSGNLGVPTGGTPGVSAPTGASPRPGGQRPGGQQQGNSVLDNILSGNAGGADLARLIAGLIGSNQQRQFGQDLLDRAAAATPNREFYEGALRQTYENPSSFLEGPEFQAIQNITHNKLQRSDAAGGRLANDYGRQIGLQDQAYRSLDQHRRTLSGITGQNQNTYSGQNSMFMQGAQADNSWMNGILNSLLSRPQQNGQTTQGDGLLRTQDGQVVNGTYRTGAELASGFGNWFGGTDFNRTYNLDAIA